MPQLIECVPNFSEGRDPAVIDAIASAIRGVSGVQLLDIDPGADTNRTVMTFVGPPEDVIEAAFQAIKTAAARIDMRRHSGAHPRMGATDVCPLIPIEGVDIATCVKLAERLGERVGRELAIPVFLYEYAARNEERRNLANIRAGEYEGLERKLADPRWAPDFGDGFNAQAGATVIGAREFLIAYNVNLNTRDKKIASDIALSVRESGRLARDDDGNPISLPDGSQARVPGMLEHVKAVGWYIEAYKQAQVSINLTNFKVSPPHVVFDAIRAEAEKRGVLVTGSELVGLIPLEALTAAGRHYLLKANRSPGVSEEELVETAIRSLGLDQLGPFDPAQKVIEYRFRSLSGPLASLPVRAFANVTASDAPAPGGGSVSALAGALAASLVAMVANLTANGLSVYQRRKPDGTALFERMCALAEDAQQLKDGLLGGVDRDTEAFNVLMGAMREKAETDAEKAAKRQAVADATKGAIAAPLETMRLACRAAALACTVGEQGNPNALSDAGVAGALALAAAQGAWYNVCINLKGLCQHRLTVTNRLFDT
ncbi:MAG: glutamate formimidoyltransferase [Proteobacteria bacterium]|nr:glutamate formimidoyltransferase [Pseudomonadota bacterium]